MTKKMRLYVGRKHIKLATALNKVEGGINNPVKLALVEKLYPKNDEIWMKNRPTALEVEYFTVKDNFVRLRAQKTKHYLQWFKQFEQRKAKPTKFRLNFSQIS